MVALPGFMVGTDKAEENNGCTVYLIVLKLSVKVGSLNLRRKSKNFGSFILGLEQILNLIMIIFIWKDENKFHRFNFVL